MHQHFHIVHAAIQPEDWTVLCNILRERGKYGRGKAEDKYSCESRSMRISIILLSKISSLAEHSKALGTGAQGDFELGNTTSQSAGMTEGTVLDIRYRST